MENHNPSVNMDSDLNKYAAVPQVQEMAQVQNQVQHIQMAQVNQMQQAQVSQMQQVQVNQMQQSQVNQMQQSQVNQMQQSQVTQLQQSQVSQMQQSQVAQMQQSQVSQLQQPQVTQLQQPQVTQLQQSQVTQMQQPQITQLQQSQVTQMQHPQVTQIQSQSSTMQQVQVQQPQMSHVQVQNSDGLPSAAQQVTIVTNAMSNSAMGTLHDALTNRLNQNIKLNTAVTVPSTHAAVSLQTPSSQIHQSKAHLEPQPTQILTRARMQDLVREVDPNEQLDEDVEEILLQMADDFVESSITAACLLAKHRKSSTVEVKDLQLHLERNWNMWIPGFGTDELRPYKRSSVNDAHKQRLTLIRKTLKKY